MTVQSLLTVLGICVVLSPAALLAALGVPYLVRRPFGERITARLTQAAVVLGLLSALGVLAIMLVVDTRLVTIELGEWVALPEQEFHFTVKFLFDRLSVPFAILSFVLCGVVGAFGSVYLHREPGFHRFFLFYAIFLLGMIVTSLAGTIETLFVGWELVGLSSALLVAFFQERPGPVRNGQRVWTVYRISDAALLMAAIALHHHTGEGDFTRLMGPESWPDGQVSLSATQALLIGLLFLTAAAGKSALVPFSGWLPRAMEGPTPSSAIFYGALSVHLGAFLLLRVSPLLELSPVLSGIVVALGLITAVYAALVGQVQTDVKSGLSFASLTQIGIIVVEIGLGLRYIALIHILGHACLRTLQFLRAPSILRDYHALENALGERLSPSENSRIRLMPESARLWIYRFACERGYLDALLDDWIVKPFVAVFRWCDAMERRWLAYLAGESAGGESAPVEQSASSPLDEL